MEALQECERTDRQTNKSNQWQTTSQTRCAQKNSETKERFAPDREREGRGDGSAASFLHEKRLSTRPFLSACCGFVFLSFQEPDGQTDRQTDEPSISRTKADRQKDGPGTGMKEI
mmetsp:Transcript_45584/g.89792  ORF Transcript_45584/g.89792 Transcript_45584/m.89792 type:complete len:115 (+) Transcript_45584:1426-1770(+)